MITKIKLQYIFILFLFIGLLIIIKSANKEKNYKDIEPSLFVSSNELIDIYINNETKANDLYTDQLIEISGTIKKINHLNQKSTIILKTNFDDYGIICELNDQEIHKLSKLDKNIKVSIKGVCKGFLKDVILLNCYLNTNKTYE